MRTILFAAAAVAMFAVPAFAQSQGSGQAAGGPRDQMMMPGGRGSSATPSATMGARPMMRSKRMSSKASMRAKRMRNR